MRLRTLHGVSLIAVVLIMVILTTGVAYATVRFVPDLVRIIHKSVNNNGHTEYTVSSFEDCYSPGVSISDKFEVMAPTLLSDSDVQKTLQAKCELAFMNKFVDDTWPTYGQHKDWKDGDTIYYTRPDRAGVVERIDDHSLVLRFSLKSGDTKSYNTFEGRGLGVYSRGMQADMASAKPGDYVYSVVRATEKYRKNPADKLNDQPVERGLVAVVRLSQPEKYYTELQQYVQPVIPCPGNSDERCSDGPAESAIQIYPRSTGITMSPPSAPAAGDAMSRRAITGTVTSIQNSQLSIKASSGARYSLQLAQATVDDYNQNMAPYYYNLVASDTSKIRLHIGSWISVSYTQQKTANRRQIANNEINEVMLLTNIPVK